VNRCFYAWESERDDAMRVCVKISLSIVCCVLGANRIFVFMLV